MKPLEKYADIHSHRPELAQRGDTIVSISPDDEMLSAGTYSVGIHPWSTADGRPTLAALKRLVTKARDQRVVAIGECGFDRIRGGDVALQTALFDFHARLARKLDKPMIIHSVRADDLLLAAVRRHRPVPGQWIIHGYRGKPDAARRLLQAGLALSFGKKHNPSTLAITPPERAYHETDDVK